MVISPTDCMMTPAQTAAAEISCAKTRVSDPAKVTTKPRKRMTAGDSRPAEANERRKRVAVKTPTKTCSGFRKEWLRDFFFVNSFRSALMTYLLQVGCCGRKDVELGQDLPQRHEHAPVEEGEAEEQHEKRALEDPVLRMGRGLGSFLLAGPGLPRVVAQANLTSHAS